ncbi:MAG: acyl-CoA dehydrogenase [Anaerolineae bacterium UTCFX2]|jgi:alkylation response protein AidB-like acyl-CoA dehydrogenase|nr:acyl-CoA dehydrogenase family protein [Anaerolineae bacterium]MCZ7551615.1 acyl-CoA dehydrogenase family protein [Anaerolineales bacterium]OQY88865.1 MAG: acyl-CoA dehydrogenase [Anaerolineae bacterium UTCFX2]
MYSFEATEEQQMLVEAVRRYAQNDLRPAMHDADEENSLPHKLIEKGWELGFLQASVPEAYGGFGERSAVTGVLAAEELAYGDLAGGLAVLAPGLFATPIALAGSEAQKQTWLPQIVEGSWAPYTAALIEPALDFDPQDLKTTAVEAGDEYLLNGVKTYVPYAEQAEALIVYAQLNGATQGFILRKGQLGVEIGERQKTLGVHALPLFSLKLKEVHVAKEDRLGGAEGHEFAPLLASMQVALAALAVGMSRAALDYAIDYAKDREVFGVKVAQKQAIAFMLAEMATEIEAIRLLVWEAAWMLDSGKAEAYKTAYLALTGAIDMAMMVGDRAVQTLGGHGYIREHPVELWMRNGRGFAMLNGLAIV